MRIPAPPKWSKAVDVLDLAEFLLRAKNYERSRLPRDMVFPREGQIWQVIRDCEVGFVAFFTREAFEEIRKGMASPNQPPFFPCGTARLNQGERVRILAVDDPRPLVVSFLPVQGAELEDRLVPEHIRKKQGYSHFQLTAPTARTFGIEKLTEYFGECFQLVEDAAGTS